MTDLEGNLKPIASRILDCIAFFKGEHDSIAQAVTLLENERDRWKRLGPEAYKPTQLSAAVLNFLNAKSSAVDTTGLVGLALWGMSVSGEIPSLTRAQSGVAELLGQLNRFPYSYWDINAQSFIERLTYLPSSERAVRQAFDAHKHGVHICAARLTANEYLEPQKPFDYAPLATESYIITAAAFQQFFAKFDAEHRHPSSKPIGLYHFGWDKRFQPSCPVLLPTKGLMEPLMAACGVPNRRPG